VGLEDVSDIYLARAVVEVAAVKHALAGNTTLDISGLHAAQARIRGAAPPDAALATPSCELIAAGLDFHRALVALADRPRLSRAHETLAAESQMMLNWHPGMRPRNTSKSWMRSSRVTHACWTWSAITCAYPPG